MDHKESGEKEQHDTIKFTEVGVSLTRGVVVCGFCRGSVFYTDAEYNLRCKDCGKALESAVDN